MGDRLLRLYGYEDDQDFSAHLGDIFEKNSLRRIDKFSLDRIFNLEKFICGPMVLQDLSSFQYYTKRFRKR